MSPYTANKRVICNELTLKGCRIEMRVAATIVEREREGGDRVRE